MFYVLFDQEIVQLLQYIEVNICIIRENRETPANDIF